MTDAQPDGSFEDDTVAEEFLTLGRRRRRRPSRWQRSAARLPRRYLLVLAASGWLAAAVLCVIAPLSAVGATAGFFQDRARTQSGPQVTSADEVFVIGALREGAE